MLSGKQLFLINVIPPFSVSSLQHKPRCAYAWRRIAARTHLTPERETLVTAAAKTDCTVTVCTDLCTRSLGIEPNVRDRHQLPGTQARQPPSRAACQRPSEMSETCVMRLMTHRHLHLAGPRHENVVEPIDPVCDPPARSCAIGVPFARVVSGQVRSRAVTQTGSSGRDRLTLIDRCHDLWR